MKHIGHWLTNLERPFNNSVKKDSAGRTVYFPWGYLSKGYVIESATTETRMRKAVKIYNSIWAALVLVFAVLLQDKSRLLIPSMPAMWTLFYIVSRIILADCPVSPVKLSFREYNTAVSKNFNKPLLFLFLLGTFLFTGVCIWVLSATISHHASLADKALVLFGILFFGFATADLTYVFSLKE